MAGHSKWAQIKRKKAVTDQKRSKEFSRLGRLLATESRRVGGDQSAPTLRAIMEKARAANMSKETIQKAVEKGAVGGAGAYENITYEMYGPAGVAILIDVVTDSRNRSAQELRHLLSTLGYALAEPGAASWAFAKIDMEWQPVSTVDVPDESADALGILIDALEARDDVENVVTNASLPTEDES